MMQLMRAAAGLMMALALVACASAAGPAAQLAPSLAELELDTQPCPEPQCRWKCEAPACPAVCTPNCEEPACKTECKHAKPPSCTIKCEPAKCRATCSKTTCHDGGCPVCQHVCDPSNCTRTCEPEEKLECQPACPAPKCKWNCTKPPSCAVPKCGLACEKVQKRCHPKTKAPKSGCCKCSTAAGAKAAALLATEAHVSEHGRAPPAHALPSLLEIAHESRLLEQGGKSMCCPCLR